MIIALRLEVNVIAMCILMILIHNKRRSVKNMLDEKLYQILLYASLLYALADSIAWALDGTKELHMLTMLYSVNIICYLFCVIVPYIWTLYAEFRLSEDEDKLWHMNKVLMIPVIIYSILVIATPITGWMFSFDNMQMYQRGPLFVLQVVLSLLFVIIPTVRALCYLNRTTNASKKQDCLNIAGFVIFPIIGLVVQVLYYGMPAAIITIVIAELMIFINLQNKQISLDSLTNLNNRGQLNRYLNIQAKREYREGKMYLLILDIDCFKSINDTFGHFEGDQALMDMASILQIVCSKHSGFLARYGGDEFAIVIEKNNDDAIIQLVDQIQNDINAFNDLNERKYKLSISIGYAMFGTEYSQTVEQLIEVADNQMYQMKIKKHAMFDKKKLVLEKR